MVSLNTARQLALSLPEAEEQSHFHLPDFRVKKKIFASLHEDKNLMMVKLNTIDQSVFCEIDSTIIYPVPGGWGKKGATFINLKKIKKMAATAYHRASTCIDDWGSPSPPGRSTAKRLRTSDCWDPNFCLPH